jgi:diadenosine tetraphosphate (Ap4A) HIT family hydrolase
VSLEHLWAGWRSEYVTSVDSGADEQQATDAGAGGTAGDPGDDPTRCVFCRIEASGPPSEANGVLWRGALTFAVLNAYPYASGHLMVVPNRHVGSIGDVDEQESAEMWSGLRQGVAALEAAYRPDGINLGANLGRAAGAGIPKHLHLHAVPRWTGDTNFMTALAGVRVLPETLADTWNRLHRAWPE